MRLMSQTHPLVELLRPQIKLHQEPLLSLKAILTHIFHNKYYTFLLKICKFFSQVARCQSIDVQKLSTLSAIKMGTPVSPQNGLLINFSTLVDFSNRIFQFQSMLKLLVKTLGKSLGIKLPVDFNSRWHAQISIDIDLSEVVATSNTLRRGDGFSIEQEHSRSTLYIFA